MEYKEIEELAEKREGIIPSIVISETIQLAHMKEGKEAAELVYLSLVSSRISLEGLSPSLAKEAGVLKSLHSNVPMGDCIIAATAIKHQARVVSDDPNFDLIKETKRVWI